MKEFLFRHWRLVACPILLVAAILALKFGNLVLANISFIAFGLVVMESLIGLATFAFQRSIARGRVKK